MTAAKKVTAHAKSTARKRAARKPLPPAETGFAPPFAAARLFRGQGPKTEVVRVRDDKYGTWAEAELQWEYVDALEMVNALGGDVDRTMVIQQRMAGLIAQIKSDEMTEEQITSMVQNRAALESLPLINIYLEKALVMPRVRGDIPREQVEYEIGEIHKSDLRKIHPVDRLTLAGKITEESGVGDLFRTAKGESLGAIPAGESNGVSPEPDNRDTEPAGAMGL